MSNIDWNELEAIKWALDEDGMSQRELAGRLNWHEARLSKILKGKQPLIVRDLERIAEIQGRDYSWYLGEPKVNRAKGRWHSSFQLAPTG